MPGDAGGEEMVHWLVVTPVGFLLLAALIIALAASSTAKYEFERNRVQAQRARQDARSASAGGPVAPRGGDQPAPTGDGDGTAAQGAARERSGAVDVATHPAGRQLVEPSAGPAWWLVDESDERAGAQVVAGPFADRADAEWAALSAGLTSVRALHGQQRTDGGLARRTSPEEKAWLSELGSQLDRLPEDWDELLSEDDALTTLVVEVAAAVVEAGLPVHDCVGTTPGGGVCLTPGPAYAGVVVSWHQHERMARESSRAAAGAAVQTTMNAALAEVLTGRGFEVEPFGAAGCFLVTDLQGTG